MTVGHGQAGNRLDYCSAVKDCVTVLPSRHQLITPHPLSYWRNGAAKECDTDRSSLNTCLLSMLACMLYLKTSSPARVWQPAITQTDEDRLIELKINSFFLILQRWVFRATRYTLMTVAAQRLQMHDWYINISSVIRTEVCSKTQWHQVKDFSIKCVDLFH